jgi:hypothetical protein
VISSGKNGIGEQENRVKHLEAGTELLKSLVNICLSILFLLRGSRQVKFIPHHWQTESATRLDFISILWLDGLELGFNHGKVAIVNNDIFIFMEHLILNQWEYRFTWLYSDA